MREVQVVGGAISLDKSNPSIAYGVDVDNAQQVTFTIATDLLIEVFVSVSMGERAIVRKIPDHSIIGVAAPMPERSEV